MSPERKILIVCGLLCIFVVIAMLVSGAVLLVTGHPEWMFVTGIVAICACWIGSSIAATLKDGSKE